MTLLANMSIKQSDFVLFFSNIQPCYGKLIKPKFADGVKVNCERVIKMAGQGAVYIRSKFALTEEDEDEDDELYQHMGHYSLYHKNNGECSAG